MSGPDLYLELDESVLNELLAAGWQTGLATHQGTISFAGKDIPEKLTAYAQADWRITLNGEPLVDLRGPDRVFTRCDAKLELMIFTMIPLTFDIAFHIESEVTLAAKDKLVSFKPVSVVIDRLVIRNQVKVTDAFLESLNRMLSEAMLTVLGDEAISKTLPKLKVGVNLPTVPDGETNELPVSLGSCLILDEKRLAVGVTFLSQPMPDVIPTHAVSSAPVFVSLSQSAMQSVFDFWWEKTSWGEPIKFAGTLPLNAKLFVQKSREVLTRALTLGFLQRESDIDKLRLDYRGTIMLENKPELLFRTPNQAGLGNLGLKVELDISIKAEVDETISLDTSGFIPDRLTPWNDDIKLRQGRGDKQILHLSQTMQLHMQEAAAELNISTGGSLVLKAVKADLQLDFGDQWYQNLPESLLNGLVRLFNQKIIDHLPALPVAPALLLGDVRLHELTPVISARHFQVHDQSSGLFGEPTVTFATGIDVAELRGKTPVPGYIANKRSQRVHRVTCDLIRDVRPEHREGYYVLHEALRDGYQACQHCLKGAVIS